MDAAVTETTIGQLQDEIAALESRTEELAKELEAKRDEKKTRVFAEIIALMAEHEISIQELVESFGGRMPKSRRPRAKQESEETP